MTGQTSLARRLQLTHFRCSQSERARVEIVTDEIEITQTLCWNPTNVSSRCGISVNRKALSASAANKMNIKHSLLPLTALAKLPSSALIGIAVAVFFTACILSGCSANNEHDDFIKASEVGTLSAEQCEAQAAIYAAALNTADERSYVIQRGDELAIDFYLDPEFNDQVAVSPTGNITLRLIGSLPAAGLTPSQLAQNIDKKYLTELRSPDAVVHVKNMPEREVYVQGQVNKPGSFPLQNGMTALQAIADAGGVTPDANDGGVVLIRRDACGRAAGERIDVASAIKDPGNGEDAVLVPRDIIVVPRSRISNIGLFVRQYIRDLLPIQPYMPIPVP
jgi:protein involved in polysaccharide export with SLBB domain